MRANNGRYAGTPWQPPEPGPGVWELTLPGYLPLATPWIREVTPWTMASPLQFHPPPPPDLDSDLWVRDYQETKDYGGEVTNLRTEEQADLARFVGGAGVHAMLQWHDAWRDIAKIVKAAICKPDSPSPCGTALLGQPQQGLTMLPVLEVKKEIAVWDRKRHK